MKKFLFAIVFIIFIFVGQNVVYGAVDNQVYYEEMIETTQMYKEKILAEYKTLTFSSDVRNRLEPYQQQTYKLGVIKNDSIYSRINNENVGTAELMRFYYKEVYGIELKIVEYLSYDQLISDLDKNEIDFAFPLTKTLYRQYRFNFSKGILNQNLYIFSENKINSLDDITNYKIGYLNHTVSADLLNGYNIDVTMISLNSLEEVTNALNNKTIDFFIDTMNSYSFLVSEGYNAFNLMEYNDLIPLSIASNKKIDILDLIDIYNPDFNLLLNEYNNKILKLYSRVNIVFTEDELRFLASTKVISVNLFEYSSYIIYDPKTKTYSGLAIELLDDIAKILDIKYRINNEPGEHWSPQYNEVIANDVDMIGIIYKNPEREKILYFSTPYHKVKSNIIKLRTNNNEIYTISDLKDKKIGVVKGDYYHYLISKLFPEKQINIYDNYESLYKALDEKKVEYIFMEYNTYVDLYNNHRKSNWEIAYTFSDEIDVSFAFPRTYKGMMLSNLFSKAMSGIDMQEIENNYLTDTLDANKYIVEQRYYMIISIMSGALLLILLIFIVGIRKRQIAKIHQKNDKMKIEMLRILSHDLKIPLTISRTNSQMLEKGYYNEENFHDKLKAIIYGIDQTDKVLKDINTLLNIEETLNRNKYQDLIDIKEFFLNIEKMFKDYGKEQNIQFSLEHDDKTLIMKSNEYYLKMLIYNILDNAFKYNVDDGRVNLKYVIFKKQLIIKISDTGIGIEKENLMKIFNQFYKIDYSRQDEGYGLGLSIVKKIAQEFNADVEIISEINKGTTIEVKLPIKGVDMDDDI